MSDLEITGLEPAQGESQFAMCVLRLARPIDRAGLVALYGRCAPIIGPAVDEAIKSLPATLTEDPQLVTLPWAPPAAGGVDEQRRFLRSVAGELGIERAWCFQVGTVAIRGLDDDDEDEDEDDDDEDKAYLKSWSNGLPPQARHVRFPVDGYPDIIENLDWDDYGIAVKLGGPRLPGEDALLDLFHTLWLVPYAGNYRNAAVTVDRRHHAAHFWVDRFAVPLSNDGQVHHLLWVIACLDQIVPVVHATFHGATMSQKYGGLMGDTSEPFVLGGNPLLAVHAAGGLAGVDAWIAGQDAWSPEELARMLRDLALEVATARPVSSDEDEEEDEEEEDQEEDEDEEEDEEDEDQEEDEDEEEDEEDEDQEEEDDEEEDEEDSADEDDEDADDDEEEDEDDEPDRKRYLKPYASEILSARARAGKLNPRAVEAVRPVLDVAEKYEHRRRAVVTIAGASRDRGSLMQLVKILDDNPIKDALDAIGKEDLLIEVARALGRIADPIAIPALTRLVAAKGSHHDDPRGPAAQALGSCLPFASRPRDVPDAAVEALLATIARDPDGDDGKACTLGYALIARTLEPSRARALRDRLAAVDAPDSPLGTVLRRAALAMIVGDKVELGGELAAAIGTRGYDHDGTVKDLRTALELAQVAPIALPPEALLPVTRYDEADLRARAHELLAAVGAPHAAARVFDRARGAALADAELCAAIADDHVVGRATLIREAGARKLAAAREPIIARVRGVLAGAGSSDENLMDFETHLLEAAVHALVAIGPDAETWALFDALLRHPNFHIKWALMNDPPMNAALIPGMFHVLDEKWGWQERKAREWLDRWKGQEVYETYRATRRR